MAIAFITLGFILDILTPSLIQGKDIRKVYVYHGGAEKEESRGKVNATLKKFKTLVKSMGVKLVVRKIEDPYDFIGYLEAMSNDVRREKEAGEVLDHYNISGGTRPASLAGLLVSAFHGIPSMMRQTRSAEMMDFPLLSSSFRIKDGEREIIRTICRRGECMTQAKLAKEMGKNHRSTIHRPVKDMIDRNILYLEDDPRDSRKKHIKVNKIVKVLLGE